MRVRPGLLFWGIFFILLGGLPLLVRAGVLDPNALADLWRFWPLLLVGLGIALILGRSRAGLLGTVVAATALGLAAGGALAAGTDLVGNVGGCGGSTAAEQRFERSGTFDGSMTANLDLDCGTLDLSVGSGDAWSVQADYAGQPPSLDESDDALDLKSPDGFGLRRQEWTVTLPGSRLRDVELSANAASATVRLAGAELDLLDGAFNAADARIDANGAKLDRIDISANAGRVRLGVDSDLAGSMSANAGALELCVPDDATLRIQIQQQLTFGHNLDDRGLSQNGEVWSRDGAADAPTIDLSVSGNAASFTLDPEDGC
jgi:hypothetical protein